MRNVNLDFLETEDLFDDLKKQRRKSNTFQLGTRPRTVTGDEVLSPGFPKKGVVPISENEEGTPGRKGSEE